MSKTTKFFNRVILFVLSLNLIFAILSAALALIMIFFSMIFVTFPGSEPASIEDSIKIFLSNITILLGIILLPSLYILGSYQLYKFFKRIDEGVPFDPYNGTRLRWIGFSFLLASLYLIVFNTILGPLFSTTNMTLGDENLRGLSGFSEFTPFCLVGLMFFVIGEAFIQGSKLEEENKLVV